MTKAELDAAYAAHRAEQVRFIAANTTFEQRLARVDEALIMFPEAQMREVNRRKEEALAKWEHRLPHSSANSVRSMPNS